MVRTEAKPKRPYKSLAEFRTRVVWPMRGYTPTASNLRPRYREFLEKSNQWPCLTCELSGWIYDPHDPPCPIEGNKMRDRIKCPDCGGSGLGTKEKCKAAYEAAIADWKSRLAYWKREQEIIKSGLAKLTTLERKVLGL